MFSLLSRKAGGEGNSSSVGTGRQKSEYNTNESHEE